MVVKYHISKETGNPNKCDAKPGNCPLGANENHYATKTEARAGYEASNEQDTFADSASKTPSRREKRAGNFEPKTLNLLPSKATIEDVKNAVAYAELHRIPAVISRHIEDLPTVTAQTFERYEDYGTPYVMKTTDVVANPDGSITLVDSSAYIHSEKESDYNEWEHHPELDIKHETFKNIADYQKFKKGEEVESIGGVYEIDPNEIFYSDRRQYSKWDLNGVVNTAKNAHRKYANPTEAAKVAYVTSSKKRISATELMSETYMGSRNKYVRAATARRAELPKKAFVALREDSSVQVMQSLASRPDLDRTTEDKIINFELSNGVYYGETPLMTLANNPRTSITAMKKIVKKTNNEVNLERLARNRELSEPAKDLIYARLRELRK